MATTTTTLTAVLLAAAMAVLPAGGASAALPSGTVVVPAPTVPVRASILAASASSILFAENGTAFVLRTDGRRPPVVPVPGLPADPGPASHRWFAGPGGQAFDLVREVVTTVPGTAADGDVVAVSGDAVVRQAAAPGGIRLWLGSFVGGAARTVDVPLARPGLARVRQVVGGQALVGWWADGESPAEFAVVDLATGVAVERRALPDGVTAGRVELTPEYLVVQVAEGVRSRLESCPRPLGSSPCRVLAERRPDGRPAGLSGFVTHGGLAMVGLVDDVGYPAPPRGRMAVVPLDGSAPARDTATPDVLGTPVVQRGTVVGVQAVQGLVRRVAFAPGATPLTLRSLPRVPDLISRVAVTTGRLVVLGRRATPLRGAVGDYALPKEGTTLTALSWIGGATALGRNEIGVSGRRSAVVEPDTHGVSMVDGPRVIVRTTECDAEVLGTVVESMVGPDVLLGLRYDSDRIDAVALLTSSGECLWGVGKDSPFGAVELGSGRVVWSRDVGGWSTAPARVGPGAPDVSAEPLRFFALDGDLGLATRADGSRVVVHVPSRRALALTGLGTGSLWLQGGTLVHSTGTGIVSRSVQFAAGAFALGAPAYVGPPGVVRGLHDGWVAWTREDTSGVLLRRVPRSARPATLPARQLGTVLAQGVWTPTSAAPWRLEIDLDRPVVSWRVRILDDSGAVVRTLTGTGPQGDVRASWNGRTASGAVAPPGRYRWRLTGQTSDGFGITATDGSTQLRGVVRVP